MKSAEKREKTGTEETEGKRIHEPKGVNCPPAV
jgi:hypothetical protein